jgi:hypothetical protein
MKIKKWPRVPIKKKHTHTHGLTFLQEGVGFVSKNLRMNSEGFILNENKEMVKSAKRPKKTQDLAFVWEGVGFISKNLHTKQ